MTDFVRTEDRHFDALTDWPFEPNYHHWKDLRVHYVDEGPADGPVMLLMHGMPTWAYLYRDIIPPLVEAGFRCIAPDHLGFGRSDKPTDASWYSIARHTEVLTSLITALDLTDITLVCQDWGGPIGLAQPATMPERFSRLVIMNTWLHHPEYDYSDGIKNWIGMWKDDGPFAGASPNLAYVLLMSGGIVDPGTLFRAMMSGEELDLDDAASTQYAGWAAPWHGMPDAAYNGARWFPLSIPLNDYDSGNGAAQTMHHRTLLDWDKDVHFVWGCADNVFTESWGREWAEAMNAPFDPIPDASHFLQNTHGPRVAELILQRI